MYGNDMMYGASVDSSPHTISTCLTYTPLPSLGTTLDPTSHMPHHPPGCLKNLNFEVITLDPIKMKGKAEPIPIFRPTGRVLKPEGLEMKDKDLTLAADEAAQGGRRTQLAAFWTNAPQCIALRGTIHR